MIPLVSAPTLPRNAAATIEATIAPVEAQSFPDWEMLVTDGSPATRPRQGAFTTC